MKKKTRKSFNGRIYEIHNVAITLNLVWLSNLRNP